MQSCIVKFKLSLSEIPRNSLTSSANLGLFISLTFSGTLISSSDFANPVADCSLDIIS